jgi:polyhydroxybutyrate depolymerase
MTGSFAKPLANLRWPLFAACLASAHCAQSDAGDPLLRSATVGRADPGSATDGSIRSGRDGNRDNNGDSGQSDDELDASKPSSSDDDGGQEIDTDGDVTSGNCGMRSGMRGKTIRSLMVGGSPRTYIAYLPSSAASTTAMPLVYVFHGASQTGSTMFDMTQYSTLADRDGIAVVFPDGQGASSATSTGVLAPWNVSDNLAPVCGAGSFANNPNAVDFAYIDAIKADVRQDQCLDTKHTFATGFSMGGYFTHHVACDRTDIKAAAPHSGGTIANLDNCMAGHVPMIIFHGTADPLISDGCDDPNGSAQSGFMASATLWAQKNGCKSTYATVLENGSGGGDGQCYVYDGCPADGQVELCTFTNMAHAWAGAASCGMCIGSGATYASATALEWAFFKKYAW